MKNVKRTKPRKKKPETCEAKGCTKKPATVLGGYWFCEEHGNRDYEKPTASAPVEDSPSAGSVSIEQCFEYLAQLCEANKKCITGESVGSPSYWSSIEHWIVEGRKQNASADSSPAKPKD